jgi:hypothetical protein
MERTARTLLNLYLQGKDHVWLYILKNLPASVYLAQRQFDLVVGNPPWLSMRYIRSPEYRRQVRAMTLGERVGRPPLQGYQLLGRQETHLFTHLELATLFFARCADLYLKEGETPSVSPPYQGGDNGGSSQGEEKGGVIAFVMPRAVLTADQHGRFTSFFFKGGSQVLKLEQVLDLEGVTPLFNVPACVLIAQNRQPTIYPVTGVVFRGEVPSRNASWEEAESRLERTDTTFDRQEGGMVVAEGETIGEPRNLRR